MSGIKTFDFTQSVASDTWTINHNLGHHPALDVVVVNEGKREKILPHEVEHASDNQTIVRFTEAVTGSARLV